MDASVTVLGAYDATHTAKIPRDAALIMAVP